MNKNKLYYFGRTCLSIFSILLLQGIALHFFSFEELKLDDAPKELQSYMVFLKYTLPILCPFGIISSIGVMRQKNWARYILSAVLFIIALGITIFGIVIISKASGTSEDFFLKAKKDFMLYGPIVIIIQVGFVSWSVCHLLRNKFENIDNIC